jgi:hypothetical protein
MAEEDVTQEPTILSLETFFTRPTIVIDDAVYEITSPAELSIQQTYQIGDLGRKLHNLQKTNGLAEAQQKQLSETLEAICEIVLEPVPAEVRAKLRDSQKLAVTEVFTMLLSEERLKLAGATVLKTITKLLNDSLGEKQSPVSNVFTAEAPKAG